MRMRSLPLLRYHWEAATHNFDVANGTEREYLTERAVADPLTTYYSYGKLREEAVPGQDERYAPKAHRT